MSTTESGLCCRSFHHASKDSPRIVKLVAFLRQRGTTGATSLEIADACTSTRPSSDVSEARACGIQVDCSYEGATETGRKIYRYRIYEPLFQ